MNTDFLPAVMPACVAGIRSLRDIFLNHQDAKTAKGFPLPYVVITRLVRVISKIAGMKPAMTKF